MSVGAMLPVPCKVMDWGGGAVCDMGMTLDSTVGDLFIL